ncbi:hypothetical protein, partial [Xylophilus ampelinus]
MTLRFPVLISAVRFMPGARRICLPSTAMADWCCVASVLHAPEVGVQALGPLRERVVRPGLYD